MTWTELADFLDAHANDMRAWTEDEPKLRAAADGLRQYAAITAAIGDLHRPMWDDPTAPGFYQTEPHREGDPAIGCCTCGTDGWPCPTAASLSPTPTPEHCPTCGSTNRDRVKPNDCEIIPDAWHDSGQP